MSQIPDTTTTSEGITTVASSNIPLTTFEVYDVENSTAENVTLEFVDLTTTTESTSSTQSVLQYLETASYKQGTNFMCCIYFEYVCGSAVQGNANNLRKENCEFFSFFQCEIGAHNRFN